MVIKRIGACLVGLAIAYGEEQWEHTELIWNFDLIASCHVGKPKEPRPYFTTEPIFDPAQYTELKRGDVVHIASRLFADFYKIILPTLSVPIVLVVNDGDASFPSDCLSVEAFEALLAHPYIIHIFAQNCDYTEAPDKISPIPIGIDFHTVAYKGFSGGWGMRGTPKQQEEALLEILQSAPQTGERKCCAFVDFQHADTMHGDFHRYRQFGEDRHAIFHRLRALGVIEYSRWMDRLSLWKTKKEYAFSISPSGNGLDCHRTWEDLALGCIVIVKSSPLDPRLYEGLPVVIVQDWNEITFENLQTWQRRYAGASINPDYRRRLTNAYWAEKIFEKTQPYTINE